VGSHVLLDRLSPFKDEISLGFRLHKNKHYLTIWMDTLDWRVRLYLPIKALGRAYGPTTGFTVKEAKLPFTETRQMLVLFLGSISKTLW